MLSKLLGFFGGKGLTTYLMIALAVSLAATAAMGYLLKEAYQDTARVQLQEQLDRALAMNRTNAEAQVAQALATQVRVTELQRRLAEVNQVTRLFRNRAEAADEALAEFEASLETRDSDYEDWSKVQLPAIIAEGLQSLAKGPLQVEGD